MIGFSIGCLKGAFGILILVGGLFLSPERATARESLREIEGRIKTEESELNRLKAQIEKERRKKDVATKKERSILTKLEDIDHQLSIRDRELSIIDWNLRKKNNEIELITKELYNLNAGLQEKNALLHQRVRILYKQGRIGYIKILFSSKDPINFQRRFKYIQEIVKKEDELLTTYRINLEDSKQKGEELDRARRELLAYKERLIEKRKEIRVERKKKGTLLAKVRTEKAFYGKVVKEAEEASSQLEALLKKLEDERKLILSLGKGFSKAKGALPWPVIGEVITPFGRQKHTQFDTFVEKKGIEIRPFQGEKIRAVYSGKVVYAGWFKGYGMLIIINHGEGYYTLYAQASRIFVSEGDTVFANQEIGEVGETGLSAQKSLYFEVRHRGEPENPLSWLRRER